MKRCFKCGKKWGNEYFFCNCNSWGESMQVVLISEAEYKKRKGL